VNPIYSASGATCKLSVCDKIGLFNTNPVLFDDGAVGVSVNNLAGRNRSRDNIAVFSFSINELGKSGQQKEQQSALATLRSQPNGLDKDWTISSQPGSRGRRARSFTVSFAPARCV